MSRWAAVISGPISEAGSVPGPIVIFSARSRIFATSSSAMEFTATTAEMAMQRSPAEPYAAETAASAAASRSASGRTSMWFFAPPSAWTRLPLAEAVAWMYRAMGVDPTKETAATSGWASSPSTAALSPCRTFSTPSGSPASAASSASRLAADGSFSLGLRTKVFPHAIASGNIHIGTMAGKLNGVMPATTPTGCRIEETSTRLETWVDSSPLSWVVMPQASSTISRPRATSPSASECTLPCSAVISAAISSRWESSRAR